jgi:pentatricopeptide repeat protein
MKRSEVVPDQLILAAIVSACGYMSHLRIGKAIQSYTLVSGFLMNAHLNSALINLYASRGDTEMAEKLYNSNEIKELVSSTAMVFGYANNGKVEIAQIHI